MRVTNRMLANNYLRNMNKNLTNMQTLNRQLSTGKEISRPSDNPYKTARSMQLNTDISTNKQYNENIKDTINWLDSTDQALYQATNTMQRIRELLVSSGNAAYGSDERNAIADEMNERVEELAQIMNLYQATNTMQRIRELLVSSGNAAYGSDERNAIADEMNERVEELAQIMNTNFDGKYIFGGTKASSKPVDIVTDAITGNKDIIFIDKEGNKVDLNSDDIYMKNQLDMLGSKLNVEVSQGVTIEYNVTAKELLSFNNEKGEEVNVLSLLGDIVGNLKSSDELDSNKLINENLSAIDDVITNLLKTRSEVGSYY